MGFRYPYSKILLSELIFFLCLGHSFRAWATLIYYIHFASLFHRCLSQSVPATKCWWHSTFHCSLRSDSDTSIPAIQFTLVSFYSWFSHNTLALKSEKSYAILLGIYERNESLTNMSIMDITGSCVTLFDLVKLLDVTLDSNLNFNKRVSSVCRVSYIYLRALRHLRHTLNDDTAKSISQALISQSPAWLCQWHALCISQVNIKKLQKVQNALAHVLLWSQCLPIISQLTPAFSWISHKIQIDYTGIQDSVLATLATKTVY